ncbi:MAG: hypothetical protein ACXVEJ_13650 [Nocardioides sp.]
MPTGAVIIATVVGLTVLGGTLVTLISRRRPRRGPRTRRPGSLSALAADAASSWREADRHDPLGTGHGSSTGHHGLFSGHHGGHGHSHGHSHGRSHSHDMGNGSGHHG